MPVADEFAFSIPNFPAFKAENFGRRAASQTTSNGRTTTGFYRDDVRVYFRADTVAKLILITVHKFPDHWCGDQTFMPHDRAANSRASSVTDGRLSSS
jgi:hypothetical protein